MREAPYIVALRRSYVPEIGKILNRGAWICLATGACGEDLVELYAYVHHRCYRDAILALASEAKMPETISGLDSSDHVRNWCQEQHPLHQDFFEAYLPPKYPWNSEFRLYYNSSQHAILQAIRWTGADGRTIRVYRSRWRHRRGVESQWAEILPKSPLPLFNWNLLEGQPDCPVILVKDEFLATKFSTRYSGVLLSTVPGGLKNALSANLEPLRRRRVRVVLDKDDLEHGYKVEHALGKAGVEDASFSLNLDETPRSFGVLQAVATDYSITLLPPPTCGALVQESPVVSAAGEPIPGADEARNILVDPIIRAGYIIWLYAEPKIGKTWVALALAHAAERGNCQLGRWRTTESIGVLYVDGEMLPDELQQSISMVMAGAGDPPGSPPFATICAQCQADGVVDITSEQWQQEIEKQLAGKQLLILDNFQSVTDNGSAAFNLVRPWLRKLTQMGITVLVLDHTNREGELQGSFAKERFANLSIVLRYPDSLAKEEGRIQIEYPRARRLYGADAAPFQLQKIFTETSFRLEVVQPITSTHINVRPQIIRIALVVFARDEEHLTYPEIQKKYCIAQSTAHGYYQEAPTLVGDERAVFDRELECLIVKRGRFTSR